MNREITNGPHVTVLDRVNSAGKRKPASNVGNRRGPDEFRSRSLCDDRRIHRMVEVRVSDQDRMRLAYAGGAQRVVDASEVRRDLAEEERPAAWSEKKPSMMIVVVSAVSAIVVAPMKRAVSLVLANVSSRMTSVEYRLNDGARHPAALMHKLISERAYMAKGFAALLNRRRPTGPEAVASAVRWLGGEVR